MRWLGTEATDAEPILAASVDDAHRHCVSLGFALLRRAPLSSAAAVPFVPAGVCYGLSYVCLFEAFYRGRVSVVSPIVATESLWGVLLSWLVLRKSEHVGPRLVLGAVLVVAGGVLIGIYR